MLHKWYSKLKCLPRIQLFYSKAKVERYRYVYFLFSRFFLKIVLIIILLFQVVSSPSSHQPPPPPTNTVGGGGGGPSIPFLSLTNSLPQAHKPLGSKICRWVNNDGTVCGKAFSKLDSLRRHVNELHKGVRPFACTSCDKNYGRRDYLDRHMKTHDQVFLCVFLLHLSLLACI